MLLWSILPAILLAVGGLLLSVFKPSTAKKLVIFFWQQKLFTLGLMAVIWLIFWGPDWSFLHHHVAAGVDTGTDWVAFRGGPARQGAAPGFVDPTVSKIVWTYQKYPMVYSTPTVRGDRVYVTTMQMGAFGDSGAVVCLDARTGAEIWRYAPRGFRATFSSPAVSGDYLVCGEGLHWYQHARITCLDLKAGGKRVWEFRTNYHVESSPCIYNGKCYFGAGHDGYYCLALKPDDKGEPHIVWHLIGPNYRGCESCPIVADGVFYAGLGNEGQAVLAIDAETGAELWRIPTHYPVFAPPTVADGKLYIGMGNGDFVNDAEAVRPVKLDKMRKAGKSAAEIAEADKWLGPAGEVWCVDLKTHQVDWKFSCQRTILGCLALHDGKLYFGSRDGTFYCVSKEGKLLSKWNAREPILGSPAVGKDHVYFATKGGRLYCRTTDTLQPVWDTSLGSGDMFASSPTLAFDHIYVGTQNDGLRCIGEAGAKPSPIWQDGERGGYAEQGSWPAKGDFDWRYPSDDAPEFQVTAPLMALDGFAYAAAMREGQAQFLKLKLDRKLDDTLRLVWNVTFAHPISVPPAGAADRAYVVDGTKDDAGRALHALDTTNGSQVWCRYLQPGASGSFTLNLHRLIIWSGPGELTCLDVHTGQQQWSRHIGAGMGTPMLKDGLVMARTSLALIALDDQSGQTLWQIPLADATGNAVCGGNDVVVSTSSGIEVRSLQNGMIRWSKPIGPCAAPLVADADRVAAVTASGEVWEYRMSDGVTLAHRTGADPAIPAFFCIPASMLFHASGQLLAIEADVGSPAPVNPARWYGPMDWLGPMRTPVVVSDQHLLFATATKGVVCLRPRK